MSGSAGKCHPAAQQSCPEQMKSLVWGHSYKPHPQAALGWACGLRSPSLPNLQPGNEEKGFHTAGTLVLHFKGLLVWLTAFTLFSPECFDRRGCRGEPCPGWHRNVRRWERERLGSPASSAGLCFSEQTRGPHLCMWPQPTSAGLSLPCTRGQTQ